MNILPSQKKKAPEQLVPVISRMSRPFHWNMRGRRYNAKGEYVGPSGKVKPTPDKHTQRIIEQAYEEAAKMPTPQEGGGFDLAKFKPLPGRILVARGPLIKSENGVDLPENKWFHEKHFVVIRLGDGVTNCAVGDRVLFVKSHRPKSVHLGIAALCLARDSAIAAILETDPV